MRGSRHPSRTDCCARLASSLFIIFATHLAIRRSYLAARRRRGRFGSIFSPSVRRQRRPFREATRYLNEVQFTRTFRVPPFVFSALVELLRSRLDRDDQYARKSSGGKIDPSVRLAVTLRMLAGGSYLDLVTNYNIASSTVYAIFHDTIKHLSSRIRMPGVPLENETALKKLSDDFQTSRVVPNPLYGCVGALDGICVRVMKPHNEYVPRKFFCRKGMHAIPVQAVVSSSYKFMYMSAMCAGSTNDCTAFAVSGLGRRLKSTGVLPGFWIAGHAAYECRDGALSPWSKTALQCQRMGDARDAFNFFHSSSRVHVEQSFGILVARFGILWRPLRFDLTKVPLILSACMRIHNFCIDHGVSCAPSNRTEQDELSQERAFRAWWNLSQSIRTATGEFRSRTRDETMLFIRENLTAFLDRNAIFRPPSFSS